MDKGKITLKCQECGDDSDWLYTIERKDIPNSFYKVCNKCMWRLTCNDLNIEEPKGKRNEN